MPGMTRAECKREVYKRLWDWGEIVAHGYLPGKGDGISSGNKPGSRPPVPTWVNDLDRAFANLNPLTYGLGQDGSRVWLVTAPFNEPQWVIWHFYVKQLGCTKWRPVPDELMDNRREMGKQQKSHEAAGDVLVGEELGINEYKAGRTRRRAVNAMVDSVRWHLDEEEEAA